MPSGYSTEGGAGICKVNDGGVDYPGVNIPDETWSEMEAAGVVFLPAAGSRESGGTTAHQRIVSHVNIEGDYWSSTTSPSVRFPRVFVLLSDNKSVNASVDVSKYYANSIRLVTDVK